MVLGWLVGVAQAEPAAQVRWEEAQQEYDAAHVAWRRGQWHTALEHAKRSVELDPGFAPARLMVGYVMLNLGDKEGARVIEDLIAELPAEEQASKPWRLARRLARRVSDRWRRDQVSVSLGTSVVVHHAWDDAGATAGTVLALGIPMAWGVDLPGRWVPGARVALGGPFSQDVAGELGIHGARWDALVTGAHPIGRGVIHVFAGFGPSLWYARGRWWPDGSEPYLGVRESAGGDWRFTRRFGFLVEETVAWYPGVGADLPWYGTGYDVRFAIESWWGP